MRYGVLLVKSIVWDPNLKEVVVLAFVYREGREREWPRVERPIRVVPAFFDHQALGVSTTQIATKSLFRYQRNSAGKPHLNLKYVLRFPRSRGS